MNRISTQQSRPQAHSGGRLLRASGLLAWTVFFVAGCHPAPPRRNAVQTVTTNTHPNAAPVVPPERVPLPPGGVKGIYLTGWTAGLPSRFNSLVGLVDRTELNSMVIDVKDDGEVSYDVDVPLARDCHASQHMFKIDKLMSVLKAHNIFPIARIVCMRDKILPLVHPEMAIQTSNGQVWHDRTRHAWLNPFDRRVWDYNVDIALDAIKHGFKEIQFDYVRCPSEGKVDTLVYPGRQKGSMREDQIAAFMEYAAQKVKGQGAWFSADVFGLTSLVKNDEGIGQKFEKVIRNVDYLCPMVYPSHYNYGEYHLPDPNTQPYRIITLSVGDALKRLKRDKATCKLRPWIQDFSLRGVHYGPEQVRAEMKALDDLGIHEFLLWNARNRFTEAALKKDTPPHVALSEPTVAPVASTPGHASAAERQ